MEMLDSITFDASSSDREDVLDCYRKQGVVRLRNLLDEELLDSCKKSILSLIHQRMKYRGKATSNEESLDEAFNRLCEEDRKLGGEIYDHVRDLPDYYRILLHPSLMTWVTRFLPGSMVQIPFDLCLFHIHRPHEDRFAYEWHQDYTYNLLSINAVTVWLPLTDVTEEMGALHLVPGSHQEISRVRVLNPDFRAGSGDGGKVYELEANPQDLNADSIQVPVSAGDALFFSSLLLHRSSPNRARRSRWSLNPRYGHFLDEELVKRGWHSGRDRERRPQFMKIHPDLCIMPDG